MSMFSSGWCSLWPLECSHLWLKLILPLNVFLLIVLQLYRYLFYFSVDILRNLIQIVMGLFNYSYVILFMCLFL